MPGTFSSARGRISLEPLESRQLLSVALPQVVAPATGPSGSAPSVSATPTPASVKGVGITFDAEATEPFNGLVGELLGLNSTKGVYANIDWGDGTSDTAGTFVPLPTASPVAGFGIEGQHTYAKAGTYAVSIIVTRQIGPPGSATPIILVMKINSKAVVSADQEGGVTLFEPARQQFTATVGTFDYVPLPVANAVNPVLSATIDWGDGKTTAGVIEHINSDDYAVMGTHEYAAVGQYHVHVIVVANLVPPSPTPVVGSSTITPPTKLIADFFSTINALPAPSPTA